MKCLKYYIIALVAFVSIHAQAQVVLLLNNSNTVEGVSYSINKQDSSISITNAKGKKKEFQLYQVFSVTDSLKHETVFYKKDSSNNAFSEAQMKDFIRGERDAKLHFNPITPYFAGAGVSLAAGGLCSLVGISVTYSALIPGAYCTVVAFKEMKEEKYKPFAAEPQNPYFLEGFKRKAAEKRLRRNLIGAGLGLVTGILIFK